MATPSSSSSRTTPTTTSSSLVIDFNDGVLLPKVIISRLNPVPSTDKSLFTRSLNTEAQPLAYTRPIIKEKIAPACAPHKLLQMSQYIHMHSYCTMQQLVGFHTEHMNAVAEYTNMTITADDTKVEWTRPAAWTWNHLECHLWWRTNIVDYRPFPPINNSNSTQADALRIGKEYYINTVIGGESKLKRPGSIFGKAGCANSIDAVMWYAKQLGDYTELVHYFVVVIAMKAYFLLNGRILRYEPQERGRYHESLPQFLYMSYRRRDFALVQGLHDYLEQKKTTLPKIDMYDYATRCSLADFICMLLFTVSAEYKWMPLTSAAGSSGSGDGNKRKATTTTTTTTSSSSSSSSDSRKRKRPADVKSSETTPTSNIYNASVATSSSIAWAKSNCEKQNSLLFTSLHFGRMPLTDLVERFNAVSKEYIDDGSQDILAVMNLVSWTAKRKTTIVTNNITPPKSARNGLADIGLPGFYCHLLGRPSLPALPAQSVWCTLTPFTNRVPPRGLFTETALRMASIFSMWSSVALVVQLRTRASKLIDREFKREELHARENSGNSVGFSNGIIPVIVVTPSPILQPSQEKGRVDSVGWGLGLPHVVEINPVRARYCVWNRSKEFEVYLNPPPALYADSQLRKRLYVAYFDETSPVHWVTEFAIFALRTGRNWLATGSDDVVDAVRYPIRPISFEEWEERVQEGQCCFRSPLGGSVLVVEEGPLVVPVHQREWIHGGSAVMDTSKREHINRAAVAVYQALRCIVRHEVDLVCSLLMCLGVEARCTDENKINEALRYVSDGIKEQDKRRDQQLSTDARPFDRQLANGVQSIREQWNRLTPIRLSLEPGHGLTTFQAASDLVVSDGLSWARVNPRRRQEGYHEINASSTLHALHSAVAKVYMGADASSIKLGDDAKMIAKEDLMVATGFDTNTHKRIYRPYVEWMKELEARVREHWMTAFLWLDAHCVPPAILCEGASPSDPPLPWEKSIRPESTIGIVGAQVVDVIIKHLLGLQKNKDFVQQMRDRKVFLRDQYDTGVMMIIEYFTRGVNGFQDLSAGAIHALEARGLHDHNHLGRTNTWRNCRAELVNCIRQPPHRLHPNFLISMHRQLMNEPPIPEHCQEISTSSSSSDLTNNTNGRNSRNSLLVSTPTSVDLTPAPTRALGDAILSILNDTNKEVASNCRVAVDHLIGIQDQLEWPLPSVLAYVEKTPIIIRPQPSRPPPTVRIPPLSSSSSSSLSSLSSSHPNRSPLSTYPRPPPPPNLLPFHPPHKQQPIETKAPILQPLSSRSLSFSPSPPLSSTSPSPPPLPSPFGTQRSRSGLGAFAVNFPDVPPPPSSLSPSPLQSLLSPRVVTRPIHPIVPVFGSIVDSHPPLQRATVLTLPTLPTLPGPDLSYASHIDL